MMPHCQSTILPARRPWRKVALPSWLCKGFVALAVLVLAWPPSDEALPAAAPFRRISSGDSDARTIAFALAPDGTTVALSYDRGPGHIVLRSMRDGHSEVRFLNDRGVSNRLEFSPDGRFLAAGGQSPTVVLFDLANDGDEAIRSFAVPGTNIKALALSPDGRLLAAATNAREAIAIWRLASDAEPMVLHGQAAAVDLQFSPDGRLLAAGELTGGTVRVWDLAARRAREFATESRGSISSVAFSPDGRLLAAVNHFEGALWIWDLKSGRRVAFEEDGPRDQRAYFVRFSPDGSMLAVAGRAGALVLRDCATGKPLARLNSEIVVPKLAFSADGRAFAVGGPSENEVRLWRMRDVLAGDADRSGGPEGARVVKDGDAGR